MLGCDGVGIVAWFPERGCGVWGFVVGGDIDAAEFVFAFEFGEHAEDK